ncbi:hypothetical protein QBC43DRAFT_326181 [Cladorrhinum sp. PSN259]|nr:hypothetical protein QBC43DRAFT_326181 [Cladorrhinum sp. PSN259]
MAFYEPKSTAPFKPSKLRNSQSLVNIRSSASSPEQYRTYGRCTPQDEPWISRPDRTSDLRPNTTMSLYSSSPSSLVRRLSPREHRLSLLNRAREAKEDDSGSESESWTTRAERRQSLARRLASPTARIATDSQRAEIPRRSVSANQVRHSLTKSAPLNGHPPPYCRAKVSDGAPKEQHVTNPETVARILKIWEAMARCSEELSMSPNGSFDPPVQHQTPRTVEPVQKPEDGCIASCKSGFMPSSPQDSGVRYPCPFRKRNPARFNIRDHEFCTRIRFTSMSDLRKHIVTYHKLKLSPLQCIRCKANFDSESTLSSHMLLPRDQMCDLNLSQAHDSEDGISDEIAQTLYGNDTKVEWSWERIWHLLFPGDNEIPDSDFQPIIELAEVDRAFDDKDDELKANLRTTLRLFLPEDVHDDYCGFLAGQLDLVFQTHRANVIRHCLSVPEAATAQSITFEPREQTQPRRSIRRSRQSSLVQIVKPTSSSTKHLKRFSTDPNAQALPIRAVNTPPPLHDYDTASTSPTLVDEDDDHTGMNTRDSGLGILCHLCGTEACRGDCATRIMSKDSQEQQQPGAMSERETNEWPLSPRNNMRRASTEVRGRYLRRQPERDVLRVKVDDANRRDSGEFLSASGSGSEDGRFSPQSFKQRVMRRESGF